MNQILLSAGQSSLHLLGAVSALDSTTSDTLLTGNLLLQIAVAIGLLVLAAFFLFLEFVVISGGLLGILSLVCVSFGCFLSYEIGSIPLLINLIAAPVVAMLTLRLALKRMQQSRMIPKTSIDSNAGYAHLASKLGVCVGSIGSLSTNAMPTGRAKFAGGEIDIALQSGSGSKGQAVKVISIDGPLITVIIDT